MSKTPHDLTEEFPAEAMKISALKETDAHFAKLVEEYNAVNEEVYKAETRVAPVSEETEEHMRRKRAQLKDQIWARLSHPVA